MLNISLSKIPFPFETYKAQLLQCPYSCSNSLRAYAWNKIFEEFLQLFFCVKSCILFFLLPNNLFLFSFFLCILNQCHQPKRESLLRYGDIRISVNTQRWMFRVCRHTVTVFALAHWVLVLSWTMFYLYFSFRYNYLAINNILFHVCTNFSLHRSFLLYVRYFKIPFYSSIMNVLYL